MTSPVDNAVNGLVATPRESLLVLRAALYRDMGGNAAGPLQEAGYAGGPVLFDAFERWLQEHGRTTAGDVSTAEFPELLTAFLNAAGWGSMHLAQLGPAVAALDTEDWAEGDADRPLEFPGCYFTSGMLADFMSRVAGTELSVMEVECRSTGSPRCRFLVGTADVIQQIYDAMSQGHAYQDVIASVVPHA